LVGQEKVTSALHKQFTKGRKPQALLFYGASGTGKTTLARIVAYALQCGHQKTWGSPCEACWATTWAIHEINASESLGVQEAKEIAEQARYAPGYPSSYRVIILDEAQNISKQGQNLLLKPFEEPASTTMWIICTTEPKKIIPTLRRRCVDYALQPLDSEGVKSLLRSVAARVGVGNIQELKPLYLALREQEVTSPALVLMAVEKFTSGVPAAQAVAQTDVAFESLDVCRATASGNARKLATLLKAVKPEEARYMRASVAGYMRAILLNGNTVSPSVIKALEEITGPAPLEDALLLQWLTAKLMKVCVMRKGS
jgi:hypothetical protein